MTGSEIELKRVAKVGGKWHVVHCTGPNKGKPIEGSKGYATEEEAEKQHRAIEASKAKEKSYTFYSDGEFEVKSEVVDNEKEYYLTGYISSNQRDLGGDVVTDSAIEGMVEQLKSGKVKVDIEHEIKFKPGQNPPFGRIIEGKEVITEGIKKVWVKVHLNKNYPDFKSKLQEIKQKFLNAFSIAFFKPRAGEYIEEIKDNVKTRFLNVINLVNVGITGMAENQDCDIIGVVSKSLHDIDVDSESKNIEKMANEDKETEIKSLEEKFEAEIKSLRDEVDEKTKQIDELVELKTVIDGQKTTIDEQTKQIEELQKKSTEHDEKIEEWMNGVDAKAFARLSKDMLAELGVSQDTKPEKKGMTMLQSIQ